MEFQTLYKRNATGTINQWTIKTQGNEFWTEYGQVGGQIVVTETVKCYGKNKGKINETSDEEQAIKEAESVWKLKQKSENFVTSIDDVDKLAFNPPMLAKVYDKNYTNDIKYIQPKLDGIRSNMHFSNGLVQAISRRNNEFYSTRHIQGALKELLSQFPSVHLDGELYNHVLHNDFNKIVSVVKKQKLTSSDVGNCLKYVRYSVYDMWDDENLTMTFSERSEWLKTHLNGIQYVDIVPTFEVSSAEEVDAYFHQFVQDGYEGAILRKDASYEHKRSKNLLKYKEFDDAEFEILDVCQGKKENQAEYCWVDLKNGNKCKATLSFNDEECKHFLENKDEYIGQLATVRFFGWTQDGSLRFPVIKVIRNYE